MSVLLYWVVAFNNNYIQYILYLQSLQQYMGNGVLQLFTLVHFHAPISYFIQGKHNLFVLCCKSVSLMLQLAKQSFTLS